MTNETQGVQPTWRSRHIAVAMLWITMACTAVAQAQDSKVVVDSFGPHKVGLSAAQEEKLRLMARKSASELVAGRRVEIMVTGHADQDAVGGAAKEKEVSEERSQAGSHSILKIIREELERLGADRALADSVDIVLSHAGASQLRMPPTSEANRLLNRRVEFTATFGGAAP